MESVARIYVVWELRQAGQKAEYIAERVGVNRVTVYRWLRGIRKRGIKGFVRHYRAAKKGHRHRRTHSYIEQRVLALRWEHRGCCGEKIVYWLAKEKIKLSRSTVYRILNKHLQLRAKGRKNTARGGASKICQAVFQKEPNGIGSLLLSCLGLLDDGSYSGGC